MPVEQFNYRKPANGAASGVMPLSQAWGTKVHGTDRVGSAGTSVAPAGLYSTAPFVDDKGEHTHPAFTNRPPAARHDPEYFTCTGTRVDGSRCQTRVNNKGTLCGPHTHAKNKEQSD